MKSGPTLNGCTTRPRRRSAPISPSVIVVLPMPLCVPATTIALSGFECCCSGVSVAKASPSYHGRDEDRLPPPERDRHNRGSGPAGLTGRRLGGLQLAG